jgi:hypothetical protein
MTNTNCLEDIKCPACGNENSFRVAATTIATVCDDGVEDHSEMEWDDNSYIDCTKCCHHGTLRDFRNSVSDEPYFRGPTGTRYDFSYIANRIRREAPHTLGKHISVQLEAIGLHDEMMNGTTPCSLPWTFAEVAEALDAQRQPHAATKLLNALEVSEGFVHWASDNGADASGTAAALTLIRAAIAEAQCTGILPEPTAPRLLDALQAVLPYAEAERASLCETWKRDRDRAVNVELHACDIALDDAAAAIAEAKAVGVVPNPAEIDVDALLAARRQFAVVWNIDDVQEVRPDLTEDQAWEVLQQLKDAHDAECGISWTTLESVADDLFGSAPESDETEDA